MRDVLRRANLQEPPLGARERAVLDAVLTQTASYSKVTDSTTYRELARLAYGRDEVHGRERDRVNAAVKKLAKLGIIDATTSGRGRYARLTVSISMATPIVAIDEDSMA